MTVEIARERKTRACSPRLMYTQFPHTLYSLLAPSPWAICVRDWQASTKSVKRVLKFVRHGRYFKSQKEPMQILRSFSLESCLRTRGCERLGSSARVGPEAQHAWRRVEAVKPKLAHGLDDLTTCGCSCILTFLKQAQQRCWLRCAYGEEGTEAPLYHQTLWLFRNVITLNNANFWRYKLSNVSV